MATIREFADKFGMKVPAVKQLAGLEQGISSATELTAEQETLVRQALLELAQDPDPVAQTAQDPDPVAQTAQDPDPVAQTAQDPDPVAQTAQDPDPDIQQQHVEPHPAERRNSSGWLKKLIIWVVIIGVIGLVIWLLSLSVKNQNENSAIITLAPDAEVTEAPDMATEAPTEVVTEVPTDVTTEVVATEAPVNFSGDWTYDPNVNTLTLGITADGTKDVGLTNDLSDPATLDLVRNGATAIWTTTVPGQVVFCVGELYVDNILVGAKTNCDGVKVAVAAGTIKMVNSRGPIGGMRWQPAMDGWITKDNADPCWTDGSCWDKNPNDELSYIWTGPLDGTTDVHQAANADVLQWVREGGVVDISTIVPMQIIGTCHILIQQLDSDGVVIGQYQRHNCGEINLAVKLVPGHYLFSESTSEQGGWRLSPWFGYGWRAQEAMPKDYTFIDLPVIIN